MSSLKNDFIRKALTPSNDAVLSAIDATNLLQSNCERIDSYPPALMLLGRAMMGALLLQSLTDSDEPERIQLQWKSSGIFGDLFAEAQGLGEVRGTIANPQALTQNLNENLGPGLLQVRRLRPDLQLAPTSTGIVEASGDISLDLVSYLERSEQKNCAMQLMVQIRPNQEGFYVHKALGFLVHVLPQASETLMNAKLASWDQQLRALGPLSQWKIEPEESRIESTLIMLRFLSASSSPRITLEAPLSFKCHCSEERAQRALALVEKDDLNTGSPPLPADSEIRCEFCGRVYNLNPKGAH